MTMSWSEIRQLFVVICLLMFSYSSTGVAQYRDKYKDYLNRAFTDVKAPTFTKQNLLEIIRSSKVTRVADLLPLLPESFRKQAVLVFKSGSLQEGRPLLPRVLLFNEDASLVITFNGDSSQYGFESLETMSFNYRKYSFEFEEFIFSDDLKDRHLYLENQKLFEQLNALYDRELRSGVNARMCLGCHRENARPNWEAYPFWPGVYGQAHKESLNLQFLALGTNFGTGELDHFNQLLATYKSNPRYKQVAAFEAMGIYQNETDETNTQFNELLARLNFLRLLRDLKCHPNYKNFEKYEGFISSKEVFHTDALKELGMDQKRFSEFVAEIREKQLNSYFINAKIMTETLNRLDPNEQRERMYKLYDKSNITARFQLVMKKVMNMDLMDYEMSFARGTYLFTNGSEALFDFFKVKKKHAAEITCRYQ